MATLNFPSSMSGIWSSAPGVAAAAPDVPAPAHSVDPVPPLGAGEPPVVAQALMTRANVPRSAASLSRLDAIG